MSTEVIMPALGMAQDTGIVVKWLKKAGENVTKGEPLLEVETDKAVVEVEAPASGTLSAISAEAGAEVPVGTAIAVILAAGENAPAPAPTKPPAEQLKASQAADVAVGMTTRPVRGEARLKAASPLARRLAAESSVDLGAVAGTGPEGAVQAADLPQTASGESELEVGRTWRIMAERTSAAWQAPHFYLTREVMAEPLLAYRAGLASKGERATVTDLLVKLSALTLKAHPHLCSAWRQGRLVKSSRIAIGRRAHGSGPARSGPQVTHRDRFVARRSGRARAISSPEPGRP
jgi:pyruvate dehydrogenase E2 component (dihydrolipoamide acetyltransferase)